MNQFYDLMVDLKTLGGPPTGAMIQLGGRFFDLRSQTLGPSFLKNIHLASAVRDGGTMDAATVLWWLGQDEEARKVRFGGIDIKEVLSEFRLWIANTCRFEDVRPWGNSASFDLMILGTAYDRRGLPRPWHWINERDFLTTKALYPMIEYNTAEKGTGAHNTLVDADFQAEHLFKITRWKHEHSAYVARA